MGLMRRERIKRDVGEGVGGEAEGEVACSQQRGQWGVGGSSKIAGAMFREQSQLPQSAADFSWCLSAFLFVFHCLLSSSSFGLAAATAAAAAAAAAATWLSLQ